MAYLRVAWAICAGRRKRRGSERKNVAASESIKMPELYVGARVRRCKGEKEIPLIARSKAGKPRFPCRYFTARARGWEE